MNKRRWRVRERHKKRTEQSSWHDGWLTGFNKLDIPYKYECFLSLSPKSLPLPLEHSVLVWLKKQTLTCHQFPPSQPWETDTEKERERERGRKKSLITRKCWRGSGAPVRQLRSSWHTHVYIQRHTHTHSWGRGAWRLLPQTVKPAETIGIKPDAHVRQ